MSAIENSAKDATPANIIPVYDLSEDTPPPSIPVCDLSEDTPPPPSPVDVWNFQQYAALFCFMVHAFPEPEDQPIHAFVGQVKRDTRRITQFGALRPEITILRSIDDQHPAAINSNGDHLKANLCIRRLLKKLHATWPMGEHRFNGFDVICLDYFYCPVCLASLLFSYY